MTTRRGILSGPEHEVGDPGGSIPVSDGQLLRRFLLEGDEPSFAEIVRRHGPLVLSVGRRVLGNDHDAEEAFQATFLVLARKARSIIKSESIGSWLHGVAYRIAVRAKVAEARRRAHERAASKTPDILMKDEMSDRDLAAVLHEQIETLPEKYRGPLVLCDLEGRTVDEAALELGCPRGTVSTRLARGRERLRGRMVRRGVTPSALLATAGHPGVAVATVRPELPAAMVQSAVLAAKGTVPLALSAHVLALTQGELKAMFLTQLKILGSICLTAGAAGTGTMWLALHASSGRPGGAPVAAPPVVQVAAAPAPADPAPAPLAQDGEEPPRPEVAADRERSKQNLQRIGQAMHRFIEGHNGAFPRSAILGEDGKRLLSWRVALLPYLGEEALYRQFRLGEPWDSPHNKALLAKMPQVYAPPGIKTKEPYATFYEVFEGGGALFGGAREVKIVDVTDGTSSTVMVAEAGTAVPWTKPQDLPFALNKALPRLGGIFADGFHFLSADGFVRFVGRDVDPEKLRSGITYAGGDPVDLNDLKK